MTDAVTTEDLRALRRLDLRGRTLSLRDLRDALPRPRLDVDAAVEVVRPICAEVRDGGAAAAREITKRLDGVEAAALRVDRAQLDAAVAALDADLRAALLAAADRVRRVHEAQRPADVTIAVADGLRVVERWRPVRRVGLYVPGGRVAYPSSVVMNVVPAQVAGVESIVVVSPPQRATGGLPHPAVLAACALLGVTEVYAVGGAQAVALLAYGSGAEQGELVEPVDVITGPGNVYVAAAKRLVRGLVGIDAEAGPTEIAILADATADPHLIAVDLIAQAEHDELATCLLVTTDPALADQVDEWLRRLVPVTRHVDRVRDALRGQGTVVLVDSVDAGLAVVDAFAAEHLEIHTTDAEAVAARVRNAGAIFVGPFAPVSLGDYLAGSNHVLPTGGTARHTGGLSVFSFLRMVHEVSCTADALAAAAPAIDALGAAEELAAHVAAVRARVGP
ncbi:histidinol dehydrogenase [Acidothermus cellulolyticus 11B]|uniref:Histidinol dehydrogenase n=1 Tax=Acidothermus cellulolyticus (strain ATCC 43068 / DSM 8971 / 11B) TaxID=351607 RepID=A0LTS1_ACIC1|nr:histidinol dehydrogenase [Acidothermus cellulolyticus]ABK52831.1 histidinol dehydrogenase [Acidothermus cellulolyticus 11B]